MTDPFARLGALVVKLRWFVVLVWLILLVISGPVLAPRVTSVVKGGGFTITDSESGKAAQILEKDFNASTANTVVVVFRSATQTVDDAGFRDQVTAASDRIKKIDGVQAVATFFSTGDPSLASADKHTTLALVALSGSEDKVQELVNKTRDELKDVTIEHYTTGLPAVTRDIAHANETDLQKSEAVTIPIVLILLLLVFRTLVSAAIPLVLGACSVVTAIALVVILGTIFDISIFALNIASMLGLGLGIDFSLIVVNRFREERAIGMSTREAVAMTMATAGRSITFSAVTVILAMTVVTLVLQQLMMVRSMSLAVLLVAFTALMAGLTLLPAILAILGQRIEWLPVIPRFGSRRSDRPGVWYRLSHAIMRRPWLWLGVSLLILILLALPVRQMKLIGAAPGILPPETESVKGVVAANAAFGANRLSPIQVVVQTGKDGVWKPEFLEALQALTNAAANDPRNQEVQSLTTLAQTVGVPPDQIRTLTPDRFKADPRLNGAAARFVNLNGDNDKVVVNIVSKYDQYDNRHADYVLFLRNTVIPEISQLRAYDVFVGGDAATFHDTNEAIYGRLPVLIAIVMGMTFIILMMFFQSVYLPLKAIFMNVVSILATYGALVFIFQYGVGTNLLGFEYLGALNQVTPPILFAILFGLSTDYEVFMLSRVKEYYHQSGDNEEAVATGLQHTAGVITAAGLILVGTFGSFATASVVNLKEFGLGLAIGVAIDSTIVRVIMVPATMRLLGRTNWWMPAWLKRIVPEISEGPAPAPAHAYAAPAYSPAAAAPAPLTAFPPSPTPIAAAGPIGGDGGANAAPPVPPMPPGPSLPGTTLPGPMPPAPPAAIPPSPPVTPAAPPGTPVVAQLRPLGGSVGADRIALTPERPLRFGRDERNEVQLFDPRVSPFHARLESSAGEYILTDLNSTNGVFVNGRRIAARPARTALYPGDVIRIGSTGNIFFTFELSPAPESALAGRS
jgi:RND superfamily putative drug exporter